MSRMKDDAPKKPPMVDGWFVADGKFPAEPLERMVYYARLAPSAFNAQPWKFVLGKGEIDVFADLERWHAAADAERRELHVSLGCAIEALRIAADFGGWGTEVAYFPLQGDETLVARLSVAFGGPKRDDAAADLLRHMITRHTSRRVYHADAVADLDRKRLYQCFEIGDVSLHFLNERVALDALAGLEVRAGAALLARPGYRAQAAQEAATPGLSWLLSKMPHKEAKGLAGAPLAALLTTRHDRRIDQVQAGQAFMRIALVAEAHDVRVQPLGQVIELPEARAELASIFGFAGRTPQHIFRLGHAAAETGAHPRRPLDEVVVRGA
jgi:nitroreductase